MDMNEAAFCKELAVALDELDPDYTASKLADERFTIRSFDDVGVMTMNDGLVIRFKDGSEFQLTVVQSKRG